MSSVVLRVDCTQLVSYFRFCMHLWLGLEFCNEGLTGLDLKMASSLTCSAPQPECLEQFHVVSHTSEYVLGVVSLLTGLLTSHWPSWKLHHFCHTLLFTQGHLRLKVRALHQGMSTRRHGSLRGHLWRLAKTVGQDQQSRV